MTGHHVDVYLQPDQKQWHHDSVARKNIGESWDFEKTYLKVGEYETLGDSYTLERMSNSPVRIKNASNMSQGENYYMLDNGYWANKGQRARMKSLQVLLLSLFCSLPACRLRCSVYEFGLRWFFPGSY